MPTVTLYSKSQDGQVSSASTTYATARSGGTKSATAGSTAIFGQRLVSTTYTCYETFLSFDTSATGLASVSTATLGLNATANALASTDTVNVYAYAWSDTTLVSSDWIPAATLGALTPSGTLSVTTGTTGALTAISLATGDVNLAGTSLFVTTTARVATGSAPTTNDYLTVATQEAGTSTGPKLTITGLVTYAANTFVANANLKATRYSFITADARVNPTTTQKSATADAATGSVTVRAYNATPNASSKYIRIYRDNVLLRSDTINTAWTDWSVPLNTSVTYKIEEASTSGGTTTATTTVAGVIVTTEDWFLAGSFGSLVVTPTDTSAARTLQREDFMVLGASYKTVQTGLALGRAGSLTAEVAKELRDTVIAELRDAAETKAAVYLKDPWGNVWTVAIGQVSLRLLPVGHVAIEIPFTEIGL